MLSAADTPARLDFKPATFDLNCEETWYQIPGFDSYQISSHLRVKSYHRGKKRRASEGRLIKVHSDDRGYGRLLLWKDKKYHNIYLHRLVFELAFGKIPDDALVRHLDDDKTNNWPGNLAVGNCVDNSADCKRNGHFIPLQGEMHANAKLSDDKVRAIRRLIDYGVCRGVLSDCFEIDLSIVTRIESGERWAHVDAAR